MPVYGKAHSCLGFLAQMSNQRESVVCLLGIENEPPNKKSYLFTCAFSKETHPHTDNLVKTSAYP